MITRHITHLLARVSAPLDFFMMSSISRSYKPCVMHKLGRNTVHTLCLSEVKSLKQRFLRCYPLIARWNARDWIIPLASHRRHSSNNVLQSKPLSNYLRNVLSEYLEIKTKILSPDLHSDQNGQQLNKRYSELSPLAEIIEQYYTVLDERDKLTELSEDCDSEMKDMILEEERENEDIIQQLEHQILSQLIPPEKADKNDIILEVTAGVGGVEAMLFTKEIYDMYQNYAFNKNWQITTVLHDRSELGGLRHASAVISGVGVYGHLKFEGGVHRVQRVPKTEKSGRVHTSTMTVAILPQPAEIDIQIDSKDLKIETCKSSGKGGQHINTTDSAVRIVHLPTGEAVECQQERSQLKNKDTAMKVLRSRLFQKELDAQISKESLYRKLQVGSKGRSEKLRTYNFNQDRVTDHRLGISMYGISQFLDGGEMLDNVIKKLQEESQKEILVEFIETVTKNFDRHSKTAP